MLVILFIIRGILNSCARPSTSSMTWIQNSFSTVEWLNKSCMAYCTRFAESLFKNSEQKFSKNIHGASQASPTKILRLWIVKCVFVGTFIKTLLEENRAILYKIEQIRESTEGYSRWKVEKRYGKYGKTGLNNLSISKSPKGGICQYCLKSRRYWLLFRERVEVEGSTWCLISFMMSTSGARAWRDCEELKYIQLINNNSREKQAERNKRK